MGEGLVVRTMEGLGDNLWSRPHVLALARLHSPLTLVTPWPQAYEDFAAEFSLRFAPPCTRLRTQLENTKRALGWVEERAEPAFRLAYDPHKIRAGMNHHDALEESARPWLEGTGVSPADIKMRVPEEWLARADALVEQWTRRGHGPVVLVRPGTVRREWMNPARNCDPHALQHLVNILHKAYTLVGIASLKPNEEWFAPREPQGIHIKYYKGELGVETLIALMQRCWTIGVNGFMVPMALAADGYAYVLFGGNYGYNSPQNLLHPGYDLSKLGWSEPDSPCVGCVNPRHGCTKKISLTRLSREFNRWLHGQVTDEVVMGNELTSTEYGREYYEEHRAAGLDYLGFGEWQRRYGRWFGDVLGWKSKRILDVGCACGSIVRGFVQMGVRAQGLDLNDHMIQLGKETWPELNLQFGDAARMPYPDSQFDGLHCAQVAEHWRPDEVPHILSECRRVLKAGGVFFCCMDTEELYARQGRSAATEDPTHYCIKPKAWWKEQFAAAGFEDATPEYLPRLRSHTLSMLAGSSSGSPAKYDWDFFVLRASHEWSSVKGSLERVAVVATGPSLQGFDLQSLGMVPVIAVNSAILHLPFAPQVWCTVDTAIPNRAIMRARERWPSTEFYAAVPDDYGMPSATATNRRPPREKGIEYLRRVEPSGVGLSKDPFRLTVGNSAYGALNVATLKGAKRVALFGVDGTGRYAWGAGKPRNLKNLADLFRLAVEDLRREGVEVVVGSPRSVVDCWPRMEPREALEWLVVQ